MNTTQQLLKQQSYNNITEGKPVNVELTGDNPSEVKEEKFNLIVDNKKEVSDSLEGNSEREDVDLDSEQSNRSELKYSSIIDDMVELAIEQLSNPNSKVTSVNLKQVRVDPSLKENFSSTLDNTLNKYAKAIISKLLERKTRSDIRKKKYTEEEIKNIAEELLPLKTFLGDGPLDEEDYLSLEEEEQKIKNDSVRDKQVNIELLTSIISNHLNSLVEDRVVKNNYKDKTLKVIETAISRRNWDLLESLVQVLPNSEVIVSVIQSLIDSTYGNTSSDDIGLKYITDNFKNDVGKYDHEQTQLLSTLGNMMKDYGRVPINKDDSPRVSSIITVFGPLMKSLGYKYLGPGLVGGFTTFEDRDLLPTTSNLLKLFETRPKNEVDKIAQEHDLIYTFLANTENDEAESIRRAADRRMVKRLSTVHGPLAKFLVALFSLKDLVQKTKVGGSVLYCKDPMSLFLEMIALHFFGPLCRTLIMMLLLIAGIESHPGPQYDTKLLSTKIQAQRKNERKYDYTNMNLALQQLQMYPRMDTTVSAYIPLQYRVANNVSTVSYTDFWSEGGLGWVAYNTDSVDYRYLRSDTNYVNTTLETTNLLNQSPSISVDSNTAMNIRSSNAAFDGVTWGILKPYILDLIGTQQGGIKGGEDTAYLLRRMLYSLTNEDIVNISDLGNIVAGQCLTNYVLNPVGFWPLSDNYTVNQPAVLATYITVSNFLKVLTGNSAFLNSWLDVSTWGTTNGAAVVFDTKNSKSLTYDILCRLQYPYRYFSYATTVNDYGTDHAGCSSNPNWALTYIPGPREFVLIVIDDGENSVNVSTTNGTTIVNTDAYAANPLGDDIGVRLTEITFQFTMSFPPTYYPYGVEEWEKALDLFKCCVFRYRVTRQGYSVGNVAMYRSENLPADRQANDLLNFTNGAADKIVSEIIHDERGLPFSKGVHYTNNADPNFWYVIPRAQVLVRFCRFKGMIKASGNTLLRIVNMPALSLVLREESMEQASLTSALISGYNITDAIYYSPTLPAQRVRNRFYMLVEQIQDKFLSWCRFHITNSTISVAAVNPWRVFSLVHRSYLIKIGVCKDMNSDKTMKVLSTDYEWTSIPDGRVPTEQEKFMAELCQLNYSEYVDLTAPVPNYYVEKVANVGNSISSTFMWTWISNVSSWELEHNVNRATTDTYSISSDIVNESINMIRADVSGAATEKELKIIYFVTDNGIDNFIFRNNVRKFNFKYDLVNYDPKDLDTKNAFLYPALDF